MAKIYSDQILVSIDVGTTKICVLVANILDSHSFEILGIGKSPSHGLHKGVVVDIAKTVHSIKTAIKEAELMAGIPIESACLGISGAHISSINSKGTVPIKQSSITSLDIRNALCAAKAIPIAPEQQILHILPQYFVIDNRETVLDPIDMYGVRLEVQAHIITGAIASVQNLIKCCESAGIKVNDIILEQLASADAVLSNDEKELGVALLDIGGGTSDLALYQRGSIRHTKVTPIAGNHFTKDLAIGLNITIQQAEQLKKEYGLFVHDDTQEIEVEMAQGHIKKIIHPSDISKILYPRADELLHLVKNEIDLFHMQKFMNSGLVLTGGGSLLDGIQQLCKHIFKVPIRIGLPRIEYDVPESLESPIYATGYGLLIHTLNKKTKSMNNLEGPLLGRIFTRMKSWVSDFF